MRLDSGKLKLTGAVATALLASACGSTAQVTGTQTTAQGDVPAAVGENPGLTVPSGAAPAPATTGPAGPGVRTPSGPSGVPAVTPGATTAPAQAPDSGFGFTRTKLFIGVAYDSTLSQELGGAGIGSASVGDQKKQVEAIVADLNGKGGIAGRSVVPVFYDSKGMNSQNDPNTLAQAACAHWTQDNKVFAAMTYVVQMDNTALYSCLAKKGVVFVPLAGESTETFRRYSPYLWSPAGVTPERVAPVWVPRLKALGWFRGWDATVGGAGSQPVRIGMLYGNGIRNNQPQLDTSFVTAVTAALKQAGHPVVTKFEVSNDQADLASAVLQLRNAGVTHVIGDYSIVNFAAAAESQHYRPRYATSSFSGGVAFRLFAPPGQLHGALGIGWVPSGDVESDRDPGGPGQNACRAVMQKSGQSTSVRLAWFAMTWACDTFAFFSKAIPAAGLQATRLPAVAASLGVLPGSFTFRMSFTGGRPDGVAVARDYGWVDSCGCFAYLSTKDLAL